MPGTPGDLRGIERIHRRAAQATKIALAVSAVAALASRIEWRGVVGSLGSIPLMVVAGALMLSVVDRLLMAFKWWHLLRIANTRARFGGLVNAYFQSCFISHVVPTALAPELLRGWIGRRMGVARTTLVSSMVLERVGGAVSAALLASAAIAYLIGGASGAARRVWVLFGAALLTATSALIATTMSRRAHALADRWLTRLVPVTIRREAAGVSTALLGYRHRPLALLANLLLAMLEHLTQFLCLLLLARGLRVEAPTPLLLATIAVVMLVRRVASQLDSWTATEGLTLLLYSALALTREQAVALTIANGSAVVVANLPGALGLMHQIAGGVRLREVLGGAA